MPLNENEPYMAYYLYGSTETVSLWENASTSLAKHIKLSA